MPRPFAKSWPYLLPLLMSSSACSREPEPREVSGIRSLYEAVEPSRRAAFGTAYGELQAAASADESLAVPFESKLEFRGLDLPGRLRLTAGLGASTLDGFRADDLRLTLHARLADGRGMTAIREVSARIEPSHLWADLDEEFDFGGRITGLELSFALPPDRASREGFAVVLRPQVHYRATLPPETAPPPRRQVVFVTLDTFRADHLGCYGSRVARTPCFDAFAKESVRFEQAISATNVTNPSHASMFTGLYLKDHGVIDNLRKIDPAIPNLPMRLKGAGCSTAAFVSAWNFDPQGSDFGRLFDRYDGCATYHERRAEDVYADAFGWLAEHAHRDFFVWLHHFDTHLPYTPPPPWNTMYTTPGTGERVERPLDTPEIAHWYSASDDLQYYRNMYLGEVSYLDHHFGRLVDRLRELGIWERALVVVVADHGECLGEHGIYLEHKGLYEETVHVPLLVKSPGGTRGGVVRGQVSTVDLFPTLLDLLGLPPEPSVRGRSLRPAIEAAVASEGPVDAGADTAYSRHSALEQAAIRTERHKLILESSDTRYFPSYQTRAGDVELYDLRRDPKETRDIASEEPDLVSELRAKLDAFLSDSRGHTADEITGEDEIERLRKLGYVK